MARLTSATSGTVCSVSGSSKTNYYNLSFQINKKSFSLLFCPIDLGTRTHAIVLGMNFLKHTELKIGKNYSGTITV